MRTVDLSPGVVASPPPYRMFPQPSPREIADVGPVRFEYGTARIRVTFTDGTDALQPPDAEWTVVEVAR